MSLIISDIEKLVDLCRRKGVAQISADLAGVGSVAFVLGPEPREPEVAAPVDDGKKGPDGLTKAEQDELYFSSGG